MTAVDKRSIPLSTPPRIIDHTQTLNEIVAHYPDALGILHRLGLDTCCGGALALEDAVARHGLDLATVQAALSGALEEPA